MFHAFLQLGDNSFLIKWINFKKRQKIQKKIIQRSTTNGKPSCTNGRNQPYKGRQLYRSLQSLGTERTLLSLSPLHLWFLWTRLSSSEKER